MLYNFQLLLLVVILFLSAVISLVLGVIASSPILRSVLRKCPKYRNVEYKVSSKLYHQS